MNDEWMNEFDYFFIDIYPIARHIKYMENFPEKTVVTSIFYCKLCVSK